jgi:hypothetical protein
LAREQLEAAKRKYDAAAKKKAEEEAKRKAKAEAAAKKRAEKEEAERKVEAGEGFSGRDIISAAQTTTTLAIAKPL